MSTADAGPNMVDQLRLVKWFVQTNPVLPFYTGIVEACAQDASIKRYAPRPGPDHFSGKWVVRLYKSIWMKGDRKDRTPIAKELRQILEGCKTRGRGETIKKPLEKIGDTLDDSEEPEGDRLRWALLQYGRREGMKQEVGEGSEGQMEGGDEYRAGE